MRDCRKTREDQGFFVMLEGEYEFQVEDQTFRAVQGTFVFEPRGILHTSPLTPELPSSQVTAPRLLFQYVLTTT